MCWSRQFWRLTVIHVYHVILLRWHCVWIVIQIGKPLKNIKTAFYSHYNMVEPWIRIYHVFYPQNWSTYYVTKLYGTQYPKKQLKNDQLFSNMHWWSNDIYKRFMESASHKRTCIIIIIFHLFVTNNLTVHYYTQLK